MASTFHSTLEPASFTLSTDLTEAQRGELAVEAAFYGLRDRMMPSAVTYYEQEQIGVALLKRACDAGTKLALQTAVATARALVFEMGSTTPWLTAEFQDLRYAITHRVVNGTPVWAAENGILFMYRDDVCGDMTVGNEDDCAGEEYDNGGDIFNSKSDGLAPTQLLSHEWVSGVHATLEPQYTSAGGCKEYYWVDVPDIRVTAVHGLDDAEPAMAAALRQLAALSGAE